ncbi:MAG: single-stranded-DNA-specific exonuclease RecJ [Alphaproteobacteria bacterium]|nr:single-stranded-DNA-specific exonuclease RecJ [Alphaproteobacteria bacterium]
MQPRHFLGVEKSLTGKAWVESLDTKTQPIATAISQRHQLPELLGRVLAARGVDIDSAAQFLTPSLRDMMPDPKALTDMEKAADRLTKAIVDKQKVAIFGDYDVDGATSSALLFRFLQHFGISAKIYIPDRIFEGYGPNGPAIDGLIDDGAQLIVTVDCGSTSFEALEHAARRKCDVVILDHHQLGEQLPHAVALVNPNRQDDLSGQGHLAAVGVVFLTLVATLAVLKATNHPQAKSCDLLAWLDLVALGTVCDVVPLKGLNRAYITKGLVAIRHGRNAGLNALMKTARLTGPANAYHLGFLVGPRINAGGRIGDASLGARLLTMDDSIAAETIAVQLDDLNKQRQAIETDMLAEAIAEAERDIGTGPGPSVLITGQDDWHPGIVGLLAARLKERFHRPAFAISYNPNGIGTGSARSVPGVDVGAAVRGAVEAGILTKGGGHAMAAGLTIERAQLGRFREYLEEHLSRAVDAARGQNQLRIDGAITANGATIEFMDLVERAGPYGSGHSQPVFALPAHFIGPAKIVGSGHVRASVSSGQGTRINAIAFRAADNPIGQTMLKNREGTFHLAGTFSLDHWGGRPSVQFRILDLARPSIRR